MSETTHPLDDQLEMRLARLEAGEPLEASAAGLDPAEAALVQQAAALRGLPPPAPDAARVAQQRREFLRAAAALRAPAAAPQPAAGRAWLMPALALGGVAALALCVFAPLALAALAWLRGPEASLPVALQATAAPRGAALPTASTLAPTATAAPAVAVRPPDAQAAVLHDARGLVEVQAADGQWQAAGAGTVLRAGQRVRTGALSSVSLAFYDGSQARLGAASEVSLEALEARATGARVVELTQHLGESTHDVVTSTDPGSRYVVNTPNGAGTARGTIFSVFVSPALLVRFDVDEGAVDVTHQAVTVVVVAGQSTIVTANQPPSTPAFLISGEGQVQTSGTQWTIAGREFLTHANTVVYGDPQVGDWVRFEGRVIESGQRVLDKLVLLRRAASSDFTLVGQVSGIGATEWIVAGRPVRVDAETELEPGLAIGAWVEVTGGISEDGTWWASRIRPLDNPDGELTFVFAGAIQSQSATAWVISGLTVTVSADTQIDPDLVVGQVVRVTGRLLDDGTWLAETIRRLAPGEGVFEIVGVLDSLEPLTVDGLRLVTAAWTEMDDDLAVGDRVRAEGRILDDGTWLAESIERLDDGATTRFEFVGVINSLDPWVVAGRPLSVTAETEIEAGLAVGQVVRVEGEILPDGAWLAHEIKRLDAVAGCLDLRGIVVAVEADRIVLSDGQVVELTGVTIDGQLAVATVVVVHACLGADGQLVVITIIVIYQLPALPTPTPSPTATATPAATQVQAHKVTICHRPPGNPDNAHTISVGAPAVPAHLAHGDTLGPCP